MPLGDLNRGPQSSLAEPGCEIDCINWPDFTGVAGRTYFVAADARRSELWSTNGTRTGTRIVTDLNPSGHAHPWDLKNLFGKLFFAANDGDHGSEPWVLRP